MKCLIWSVDFLQWSSNVDLRAIYTGFLLLLYLVNLLNIHQKTVYRSRSKYCVRASWPLVLLIRIWLTTFKSSDESRLVDELFVRLARYISSWIEEKLTAVKIDETLVLVKYVGFQLFEDELWCRSVSESCKMWRYDNCEGRCRWVHVKPDGQRLIFKIVLELFNFKTCKTTRCWIKMVEFLFFHLYTGWVVIYWGHCKLFLT